MTTFFYTGNCMGWFDCIYTYLLYL